MTLAGIALPSLLLVIALRRWIAPVPWRIAGLFLALTLLFLHGAVFTSKLPVPVDEVARGYPWRGLFGDVVPRNPLTNDTVKLFLPWMQVAREELAHFRAPLWNRYSFAGYPLLGNGESAPFSPLFLATLFVPLPKQIVAMAGLKIFAALLFTYLFLQREGAGDAAAIFGAVAFAWSTFLTVFLYYSTASVMALLPAAAFAVVHPVDEPRKRSIVLLALVVATLLANGHPESVFHIAIGCAVLLAINGITRVRAVLLGALFGLAISAPAWVPVLEQVRSSARYSAMRHGASFGTLPATALWALVMPNGFGNPLRHNWSWIGSYTGVAVSYAGLLPLALFVAALFAPAPNRRDRALAVAAVALFVIAMDWTPLSRVPPFSFTANDKLRCVAIFLAIVVAAKALDISKRVLAVIAAPLVCLALYAYAAHTSLMRPVDLAGVVVLVVFFVAPRWSAAVLVGAELFALNAGFNALVKPKYFRPPLPIIEALKAHAPAEPFRVAGLDWTFLPNASAQYGVEDIRGSDPMELESYDRVLRRFTVEEPGTGVWRMADTNAPELDSLNVRFLIAEPAAQLGGRWRKLYRGRDGALFENRSVLPRFFSRTARVEELRSSRPAEFSMRVTAAGAAVVTSSEVAAPGRRVLVNGKEVAVRLADGAFLAFEVPSGQSLVSVEYRPLSYWIAVVVAIAGTAVLESRLVE